MNKYELTVIVKSAAGVVEKIEKLVKALEGKTLNDVAMGKKQLAYRINKLSEAEYLNFTIELPAPAVVQLEKKLVVDKDVIRHLLVKVEAK